VTTIAVIVLCGLASWRITSLLHTEDAFEWLRKWIGIRNDEQGYPAVYPDTLLGAVFHCFWCLTLVTAAPVVIVVAVMNEMNPATALLVWLASSTIAIWTEKQVLRAQSR